MGLTKKYATNHFRQKLAVTDPYANKIHHNVFTYCKYKYKILRNVLITHLTEQILFKGQGRQIEPVRLISMDEFIPRQTRLNSVILNLNLKTSQEVLFKEIPLRLLEKRPLRLPHEAKRQNAQNVPRIQRITSWICLTHSITA